MRSAKPVLQCMGSAKPVLKFLKYKIVKPVLNFMNSFDFLV